MNIKMKYFHPKQVMFFDAEYDTWNVGIAYEEEIICACCGGVFGISEIVEDAKEKGVVKAIYPFSNWQNISEEIMGDELPEGLTYAEDGSVIAEETK